MVCCFYNKCNFVDANETLIAVIAPNCANYANAANSFL